MNKYTRVSNLRGKAVPSDEFGNEFKGLGAQEYLG